jgi:hypothetical protein
VVRYLIERVADRSIKNHRSIKNPRGQMPLAAAKAGRKDRSDIVKFFAER